MRNVHLTSFPSKSSVSQVSCAALRHPQISFANIASIVQKCSSSGKFKNHLNPRMLPASDILSLMENDLLLYTFTAFFRCIPAINSLSSLTHFPFLSSKFYFPIISSAALCRKLWGSSSSALISAPINQIYIQKYSHSIATTRVTRPP